MGRVDSCHRPSWFAYTRWPKDRVKMVAYFTGVHYVVWRYRRYYLIIIIRLLNVLVFTVKKVIDILQLALYKPSMIR